MPVVNVRLALGRWIGFALVMSVVAACSGDADQEGSNNPIIPKPQLNVNAGNDISVNSGSLVALHAAADYGGDAAGIEFSWQQAAGEPVVGISGANTPDLQFPAPLVAVSTSLLFNVTATIRVNGAIESDIDSVTVTVNPPGSPQNMPPIANAGPDQTMKAGAPVTITGSGTDSDGQVAGYQWAQLNDGAPAVVLNNRNTDTVGFIAPPVSSVTSVLLLLTVTDNLGATGTDQVRIQINPNTPPNVSAGDDRVVNVGRPVVLSASAGDNDGSITSFLWTNQTLNGPAINLSGAQTATVSFSAPAVTQLTQLILRVTVTDNDSAAASDDVIVRVNAPPAAAAGLDQTVVSGAPVTLTGSGVDVDGSLSSFRWSQSGTPPVQLNNAMSAVASFTAPDVAQPTSLNFVLTVIDNDGASASDTMVVIVNPAPAANQPPLADAGEDQSAHPGDRVLLAGSGLDADGAVVAYSWTYTPGQTQQPIVLQNSQTQTAEFTAPAVTTPMPLTFILTVTDNTGATASDTVVVTVNPFATLSGTISAVTSTFIDSDTLAEGVTSVANNPYPKFQHIPTPVTVGGYVHQENVGPPGNSANAVADSEDLFHVNLVAGQVLSLYLGQSYFDPSTDASNPRQPSITMLLTNDYATAGAIRFYGAVNGGSGVLSLTVPNLTDLPADGHYLISIQAGAASAYSYVLTVGSGAPAQSQGWSTEQDFVPGEIIVEFIESAQGGRSVLSTAQRADSVGMQALAGAPGRSMLFALGDALSRERAFANLGIQAQPPMAADPELQSKWDTILAAAALRQRADVASVRLNYLYYPTAAPNDSLYARQWHYPLINLPQAWDITTGSVDVTVAVIDTGILSNHPDIPGSRLVDGYDFIRSASNAGDGNGIDPNPEDNGDGGGAGASSFHGTHVAGTIGANTNNGIGVAGIGWQVNLMPLRVLGINGGTSYDIEQAILYAARLPNDSNRLPSRRADIINLSLGGPASNTTAPPAYRQARQAGVIIVAAAGNDGSDQPSAPAAYNGVVSFSAVTINRQKASYSNFGPTIDVAAPGGNYSDSNGDGFPDAVWSTRGNDSGTTLQYTYETAAGTSMASPHVAGVAALMKSVYPGLTPAEFDSMLENGELTQDIGASGRDNNFGYGLIDAHKAVSAALAAGGGAPAPPEPAVLAVTPSVLNFGSQLTVIEISVNNSGGGELTISGITQISSGWLSVAPVNVDPQGLGVYAISVTRAALASGLYTASVRVASDAGTLDIPVSMQVFPLGVTSNAGPQIVELVDVATLQTVQSQRVSPVDGVYEYRFSNVRFGAYRLRSGSDLDDDGTLCEMGESCGAYPMLNNPVSSEIQVDGSSFDLNNLDFDTGFNINLSAQ